MKILFYISCIVALLLSGSVHVAYAKEFEIEIANAQHAKAERYIQYVYEQIKFGKNSRLSFNAFRNGFYGYLNMVEAGKISPNSCLTICDFTLSSNLKRMWVLDIKNKKVLFNTLVAHGAATGEEFATNFSNIEESHQSSLGFYTTAETYLGSNGYSLKLNGVDGSYNSNAYERAIVIHGAEYVCDEYAKCNKRIGRSHGCPALPVEIAPKVIDKIKDGTCLFIYYDSKNYLTSSQWLRHEIRQLPEEADMIDLMKNSMAGSKANKSKMKSNNDEAISCNEIAAIIPKDQLKRKSEISNASERVISSIIIINENGKNGMADTVIVK